MIREHSDGHVFLQEFIQNANNTHLQNTVVQKKHKVRVLGDVHGQANTLHMVSCRTHPPRQRNLVHALVFFELGLPFTCRQCFFYNRPCLAACSKRRCCPMVGRYAPAWFPKVSQAAQHVIYVAVRDPARP